MVNKKILCLGFVVIILITTLSGCVQNVPAKEEVPDKRLKVVYYQNFYDSEYTIIHDNVNKVTCYSFENKFDNLGGVSCITDIEIQESKNSVNVNVDE